MSYEGVMRLARESHGSVDWLKVVKGCYDVALSMPGSAFAGAYVYNRVGWFPGLGKLGRYGILTPYGEPTRRGSRRYWIMPNPGGVARALRELGYL